MNHQDSERDELKARFTKWLDTTIHRARIDYIRKNAQSYETISIEDVPENILTTDDEESRWIDADAYRTAFDFEEEKLAKAFFELPLMRQRILTMLFVEEKKAEEIASELHCSVQHVYNQRSLALKKLRIKLEEGGEEE